MDQFRVKQPTLITHFIFFNQDISIELCIYVNRNLFHHIIKTDLRNRDDANRSSFMHFRIPDVLEQPGFLMKRNFYFKFGKIKKKQFF